MRGEKPKTLDGTNIGRPFASFPRMLHLTPSFPPPTGNRFQRWAVLRLHRCRAVVGLRLAGDPGRQSSGEVCAVRRRSADPALTRESWIIGAPCLLAVTLTVPWSRFNRLKLWDTLQRSQRSRSPSSLLLCTSLFKDSQIHS